MSAEYQRLRDAASEIDREIATIEENQVVGSAMELATIERRLNELSVRRAALSRAMLLVKSVGCPKFRQRQQEFVRQLPQVSLSGAPEENGSAVGWCGSRLEHRLLPSAERPRQIFSKGQTRAISGPDVAWNFERPDAGCSTANGQGLLAPGIV